MKKRLTRLDLPPEVRHIRLKESPHAAQRAVDNHQVEQDRARS